mmetsp:Transcript_12741/g.34237  ORF Transcript_12741/g.34237 Transcript_12741/m.34237 type:complete len:108 (-) Transcript_12741:311-634(-)
MLAECRTIRLHINCTSAQCLGGTTALMKRRLGEKAPQQRPFDMCRRAAMSPTRPGRIDRFLPIPTSGRGGGRRAEAGDAAAVRSRAPVHQKMSTTRQRCYCAACEAP